MDPGVRRLWRKEHRCTRSAWGWLEQKEKEASGKGLAWRPPPKGMLFCSWEPMSCIPYISFSGSFSWLAHPRFLSLPSMLISVFSVAWLELEFPMGRLSSPSPVSCPVLLNLLLIFFSLPLFHTLLSSSLPCAPLTPAQYINFLIAGHW